MYFYEWFEGFGIVILRGSGGAVERKKFTGSLLLAMSPLHYIFHFYPADSLLWGNTVGYSSDSLASCCLLTQARTSCNIHSRPCQITDRRAYTYCSDYYSMRLAISENIEIAWRISGIAVVIEYRDTWDGIVIVAPISGIAQHYLVVAWLSGRLVARWSRPT